MRPQVLIGTVAATAGARVYRKAWRVGPASIPWYTTIRKALTYVPPNVVFPVAWTALYGDIAVTPLRWQSIVCVRMVGMRGSWRRLWRTRR